MPLLPTLTAPLAITIPKGKHEEITHKVRNENCSMEIVVEAGAALTLILETKIDEGSESRITQNAKVKKNASLHIRNVTTGKGKVIHSLISKTEGENAESKIDWIFHATEKAQFDLNVVNEFIAPHGKGDIAMKGVAENKAIIKANGMIKIGSNGSKTETELTEYILMLDSAAKVDAVPALEIKTNDVKASHSATVTKVSEEDLFYMASRGIAKEEARRMYVEGFLNYATIQVKHMPQIPQNIRSQFPILSQNIEGNPLIYLDNAATSQKPQCVIDAISEYYEKDNANAHRGMHPLAERSTEIYDAARSRVKEFVNARSNREIVFTKNTTESINLVARTWGEENLKKGDTVLLSLLEHHSDIVPWLQLKEKKGVEVKWMDVGKDGKLNMEEAEKVIKEGNVKLMCITCVSNVLGTRTEFEKLTKLIHENGGISLLDAAQLAPHIPIDVQKIDCDFLAFSAHKIYGPMGIGVLYGKEELLKKMPPYLGGGMMVEEVNEDCFTATDPPEKFEAGTQPIAEARGLHRAIDFIDEIGWENIQKHESELIDYALKKLSELQYIKILGPDENRLGCTAFITPPVHPHDLTEYCGRKGVCMRAGLHCAQPLHKALGCNASTRMSFGIYNTKEDIDRACAVIDEAYKFFTD